MTGHPGYYRIRVASYRVGIQVDGEVVEMVRVLDRRDFYRYFP
jgi:mRNA-degrading endonuclease RelE of RelBE toxin-antitoxin system